MKRTQLAPWFGSKCTLATRIVEEIGDHTAYFEPFAGSMAVLLNKKPCSLEVVNDLHADLINLAMVCASDRWTDLAARVMRTLYADAMFREAVRRERDGFDDPPKSPDQVEDLHVDRAFWWFVAQWQGRSGFGGTHVSNNQPAARYGPGGGCEGQRWRSAGDSIRAWHDRLRSVRICRVDAFGLVERIHDKPGVVVYVDPPYVQKGAKYTHNFQAGHHERLARILRRFKRARVVVSYYENPTVRALYAGWRFVDCTMTKAMVQSGQRNGLAKAPELLIVNDTPEASEPLEITAGAGLFGGTP